MRGAAASFPPAARPSASRRWRRLLLRLHHEAWFPHIPLALWLALIGVLVLSLAYGRNLGQLSARFPQDLFRLQPSNMPFLLIGAALFLMSVGLALRSRFAWVVAVLLNIATLLALRLFPHVAFPLLFYYAGALLAALLASYRSFNRSSVAAGTLFAITSSLLLLIYAVFGSLYFGAQFSPPIRDLSTSFYYSIVTMCTVGYGDILPKTPHARLFTISIIVLGITVFATSITAIVGPLVSGSLNKIVNRREGRMQRTDHFVVVGMTPLAFNTYREFKRRKQPAVLVVPQALPESEFDPADIIVGDASSVDVLRQANAASAQAVLAMRSDDSENAFIALAVKELRGKAKTVVAVNDSKHMARIKLVQPDIIISPQVLGGEILAMVLTGETITGEFVLERFLHFQQPTPTPVKNTI